MVKLVVRICVFFLVFAFILSQLEQCKSNSVGRWLTDLLEIGEKKVDNDDISTANPVQLNILVNKQLTILNPQYIECNTINVAISEEINSSSVLIEEYNQSIISQTNYIDKSKIEQSTLLQWVNQNNTYIKNLETRYNQVYSDATALNSNIENILKEIKELKNNVNANKYKESENGEDREYKESYENLKATLLKKINELIEKVEALKKEVETNNKLLKDLKRSLNKCVTKLETLNAKLDKLIEQSGKSDNTTYYYIIDSEESLKSKGIVSYNGLFGDISVESDLNKNYFALLSEKDKSIMLGDSDAEYVVLSEMPQNSYDFRDINGIKVLIIKDSNSFWSKTQYLVVLKKNNSH